jgi:hypothetical protein
VIRQAAAVCSGSFNGPYPDTKTLRESGCLVEPVRVVAERLVGNTAAVCVAYRDGERVEMRVNAGYYC